MADEEPLTGGQPPTPGAGALLIRVWLEPGSDRPLRARITAGVSPTRHEETTVVVTEARDVVIVVQRWLDGFLTEAPGADPQG
jgi:hypothetical protein